MKNLFFISTFSIALILAIIIGQTNTHTTFSQNNHFYSPDTLTACDSTPANCAWNLRDSIFTDVDSLVGTNAISYARNPHNSDFKDAKYVEESCGTNTCTSDTAIADTVLRYEVYWPKKYTAYPTCPLPCIIIFHGGGFSDCNSLINANNTKQMARQFAQRGFVVFSCEYRRGRKITNQGKTWLPPWRSSSDPKQTSYYTTAQQVLCYFRAFQDVRGAIRSIIKRQRLHNSDFPNDKYQFDTTKVFLAGSSAGSIDVLNAAYYPDATIMYQVDGGAHTCLGSINADYYYGDTTIDYHSKIKGVLNCWGNVFLPTGYINNPASFYPTKDTIPCISFHGLKDSITPFYYEPVYFAPASLPEFNTETSCLVNCSSFSLSPNTQGNPDLYRGGSEKIYCTLNSIGTYTEIYLDTTMGHGIEDADGPAFNDDFGTGYKTQAEVYRYIVQRASVFFQSVMQGYAYRNIVKNKHTRFVECKNNRYSWDTNNNDAGCIVPLDSICKY